MNPKISIGLPVYNGENFLEEAINSILNQTFENFEIIISDNASTDRTKEICQQYGARDSRIRYYRNKENLGAAWNYNRVFELSRAPFFKWASHDDLCAPQFLQCCLAELEKDPDLVLCHPKAHIIDCEGHVQSIYTENIGIEMPSAHQRFFQLLETFGYYHGTQIFGLIRASVLKKTKLIRPYAHSDRVLLAELTLHGKFKEVPEFLFMRRIHPQVSQLANPSDRQFSIWFDPKNRKRASIPKLQRYLDYVRIISSCPLSFFEQFQCYLQLLRRLFISKGFLRRMQGLLQDLYSGTFSKLNFPFPS